MIVGKKNSPYGITKSGVLCRVVYVYPDDNIEVEVADGSYERQRFLVTPRYFEHVVLPDPKQETQLLADWNDILQKAGNR